MSSCFVTYSGHSTRVSIWVELRSAQTPLGVQLKAMARELSCGWVDVFVLKLLENCTRRMKARASSKLSESPH
jgi:hypothetical protein